MSFNCLAAKNLLDCVIQAALSKEPIDKDIEIIVDPVLNHSLDGYEIILQDKELPSPMHPVSDEDDVDAAMKRCIVSLEFDNLVAPLDAKDRIWAERLFCYGTQLVVSKFHVDDGDAVFAAIVQSLNEYGFYSIPKTISEAIESNVVVVLEVMFDAIPMKIPRITFRNEFFTLMVTQVREKGQEHKL